MKPSSPVPAYHGRIVDAAGNGVGTCFQIRPRLLVTAAHVVEAVGAGLDNVVEVVCLRESVPDFRARVVALDDRTDLALLWGEASLTESVSILTPTDTMVPGTMVAITGIADVVDTRSYKHLSGRVNTTATSR